MILAVAVLFSVVLWTHCLHYTDVQPQQGFDLEQLFRCKQIHAEWFDVKWYIGLVGVFEQGNLQTVLDTSRPGPLCTPGLDTSMYPAKDLCTLSEIKFAGSWYRIGMAYESPSFIKYKDRVLISKGFVVANENGSANLSMWTMIGPKICLTNFYTYEKTDVPGLFTYFSQRHKMMKDITVVEANYTDYAMILKYKKMDKEYTQVALYGRTPTLGPEVVEKFRLYSLSLGFSPESIVTATILDPCPIPEPTEPRNTTEAPV